FGNSKHVERGPLGRTVGVCADFGSVGRCGVAVRVDWLAADAKSVRLAAAFGGWRRRRLGGHNQLHRTIAYPCSLSVLFLPIFAGIATLFCLTNRPEDAKWLPDDERNWLRAELAAEYRAKQNQSHWAWAHHMGMVLLLTLVYFGLNVSSYGLLFFLPSIIKS